MSNKENVAHILSGICVSPKEKLNHDIFRKIYETAGHLVEQNKSYSKCREHIFFVCKILCAGVSHELKKRSIFRKMHEMIKGEGKKGDTLHGS